MGINKGERFARANVFVDYPFEEVMFRWDHAEGKVYRKFHGEREVGPIPHDNNLYNEALRSGDEITREAYVAGKPSSPERRNS
ncbi:hypothetical protein [Ralstonia pseudosolanacearum]|uniref:hypothetical protein n=1 Tax=Ralstonia pseudosolanacearum TaxID=1310165 RepID=UPI0002C1566C|nr:hypothetical protein [Ralstonia pseudosolanacearum]AGH85371.1 hypothetical protein F504_2860 [Ralstonia pseudosolanacearum FQY_4]ANH31810.1 hypothetical protein A3768_0635 [Ralstonia solanacearum]